MSGRAPGTVNVELPNGGMLAIEIHGCRRMDKHTAVCSVIKDAGDDPDITHGAEIGARVTRQKAGGNPVVTIRGGVGVGVVTKPGLEVAVGQPAINSGPQEMIRRSAFRVLANHDLEARVDVEIFVPEGKSLARKTLNARLGILGGISILGTTGIVRPLSHEAYVATIRAGLSVARASGVRQAVLTTGRRSERYAQQRLHQLPQEAFVQIGDYFAVSMEMAAALEFDGVILAVFFGKAVKMAQGMPHTHARSAVLTMEKLAHWTLALSGDPVLAEQVSRANTARQVFDLIKVECPALIEKIGRQIVRTGTAFGGDKLAVDVVIFGFDGVVWFDSKGKRRITGV